VIGWLVERMSSGRLRDGIGGTAILPGRGCCRQHHRRGGTAECEWLQLL